MANDSGMRMSLWRFALDLYYKPGVAPACLHLQERHQADVTLLLFAARAGSVDGRRLSAEELEGACARVEDWHRQIVLPLRALRKRMKVGPEPAPSEPTERLRDQLKSVEIGAEKIELEELERFSNTFAPATRERSAAEANMRALLASWAQEALSPADLEALRCIASGAEAIAGDPDMI